MTKNPIKFFVLFTLIILLSLLLSGCSSIYESKADYFDGKVLVEYYQTTENEDDNVTFTFYDKGNYEVHFSYTDGKETGIGAFSGSIDLPEDFTFSVDNAPRSKVVSQYVLPGFLTITIIHNGQVESHEFQ